MAAITDVGAVAAAIGNIAETLRPSLVAYEANRFERLREQYNFQWQAAAVSNENRDIVLFIERMCAEAGNPTGLVSADSVPYAVPVAHLNQLVACAIELAVTKKEVAALLEALRKVKP